jgi:hypothetical protein
MTPRSTKPLTEMSTRNILWGKGRSARKADNLTAICEMIVYKMCEPRRVTTLRVSTARYRNTFTSLRASTKVELQVQTTGVVSCRVTCIQAFSATFSVS